MVRRAIGAYSSYEVEPGDRVVIMGEAEGHRGFLAASGFEEHPDTGEWVGWGEGLYRMTPEAFVAAFGISGGMALQAQASDGERVCAVDSLPQVGEDAEGRPAIVRVLALELDTREIIDRVLSRMLERG